MVSDQGARDHLARLLQELGSGARACLNSGAPVAALLFILASTEFLSLYYVGSRRPASALGTRGFERFLCHYFPRFNRAARDPRGRLLRVRIPLLREGGKAFKRLKLPAAVIHLYRKGVVEDLAAPRAEGSSCVIIPAGRWGFQLRVDLLHEDFQDALRAYALELEGDTPLSRLFLKRFFHLHGWQLPGAP